MSTPTPPTPIDRPWAEVGDRLGGPHVPVDETLLQRLRDVCAAVDTDDESRAEHGRDWWPLAIGWAIRGEVGARPAVVARPEDRDQVAGVVAACHRARVPVTVAGGRSGVCGGSVPVFGGVSLDLCGLSGIVDVDDRSLLVDVRSGTFGSDLEDGLRAHTTDTAPGGFTVGHWPQSMALSTVGGWLACRGAGQYSTRYGKIEDMVGGIEVVLADGTVVRTGGDAPRAAIGPDLTQLFVGSEGTLGVITEARLRLHPVPEAQERRAFGFASFEDGLEVCRRVLRRGATPAVLRLYDATESARNFHLEDTNILVVLDEADPGLLAATIAVVDEECRAGDADRLDDALVQHWLDRRNDVSALVPLWRAGVVVDTVEVAARWSALPGLFRSLIEAIGSVEGTLVASCHQSHAYTDGACLYVTFAGHHPEGDLLDSVRTASQEEAVELAKSLVEQATDDEVFRWNEDYYRRAWDAVTAATRAAGGAISHHHGIGLNRARFLPEALGAGFGVLEEVKRALDPFGILNPGKLGLPSPFGDVPWP